MAMDQQTALERQQALYREKNAHLQQYLEPVEPYEFYREIFPEGSFERSGHFEDAKGNAIALTVPQKQVIQKNGVALEIKGDGKAEHHLITDDLKELDKIRDTDFTIMSPISYFGWQRRRKYYSSGYSTAQGKECQVSLCDGFRSGRRRDAAAAGHVASDEQGHYSQGHLRSKQRNRSASVLCADGADPYVPAESEDFEGTEILSHPADLEQIYLVHQGAADAGRFAGVPCGRNQL